MLGNNEKIEGVELKDVFTGMLAELPWDSLRAYILSNAVLAKLCTMGGFRLDPKFRSRMEKIVIKDVEKNEFNEASCNGVFASWYPVHTQLHKDLEDYFHSDGYKAYREEKGLGEDEYELQDDVFERIYKVDDFAAWRILLCFSPLKFTKEQAAKILDDKKDDVNLVERVKKAETERDELSRKVAQLTAEAERLRAKQQQDQNEIQELRKLNRQMKSDNEQLQKRAETAVAEMKRANERVSGADIEREQREKALREEMERTVQRAQNEVERLNAEVALWRGRHEEQCAVNRGFQEQAADALRQARDANEAKEAFAAKLSDTHSAVDALLDRIDWPKVAASMKPSPTVKRNLNSLIKKLDYDSDRTLTIEGTLPEFWERLNKAERDLVTAIAKSTERELQNGSIQDYWGGLAEAFDEVMVNLEARSALLGMLRDIFFQTFSDEELQEPTLNAKPAKAKK